MEYHEFKRLHQKYAPNVQEYVFADRILDITKISLSEIRNHKNKKIQVLLKTQMPKDEIEQLKNKVLIENNLYRGKKISFEEFERLYSNYEHILSQIMFAKEILGINGQSLNKLRQGNCNTIKILIGIEHGEKRKERKNFNDQEVEALKKFLIQGLSEEEIATRIGVSLKNLRTNMKALFRYERLSESDILYERIKFLKSENKVPSEISRITGISLSEVKQILNQIKIEEANLKRQERQKKRN